MNKHKIKQARLNVGLTQSELSKVMNTTIRTISRWETGECKLTGTALILFKIIIKKNIKDD